MRKFSQLFYWEFCSLPWVKLQRGKQLLITLIILYFQLFVRSRFRVAKLSVYSKFGGVICHPENGRRITSTSFNPLIFLILFLFSICLIKLSVTSPFLKFHVRESKIVLDGFHVMNSGFQVLNPGFFAMILGLIILFLGVLRRFEAV